MLVGSIVDIGEGVRVIVARIVSVSVWVRPGVMVAEGVVETQPAIKIKRRLLDIIRTNLLLICLFGIGLIPRRLCL